MDKIEMMAVVKGHLADFLECETEIFEQRGLVFHNAGKRAEGYQRPLLRRCHRLSGQLPKSC